MDENNQLKSRQYKAQDRWKHIYMDLDPASYREKLEAAHSGESINLL